jgi:hypothetical protein
VEITFRVLPLQFLLSIRLMPDKMRSELASWVKKLFIGRRWYSLQQPHDSMTFAKKPNFQNLAILLPLKQILFEWATMMRPRNASPGRASSGEEMQTGEDGQLPGIMPGLKLELGPSQPRDPGGA